MNKNYSLLHSQTLKRENQVNTFKCEEHLQENQSICQRFLKVFFFKFDPNTFSTHFLLICEVTRSLVVASCKAVNTYSYAFQTLWIRYLVKACLNGKQRYEHDSLEEKPLIGIFILVPLLSHK